MRFGILSLPKYSTYKMEKYLQFTIEDFVWDEDFRPSVLYPTKASSIQWNTWLEQHPEKVDMVKQARSIIKSLIVNEATISDYEIKQITDKTLLTISQTPNNTTIKPYESDTSDTIEMVSTEAVVIPLYRRSWFVAAASVLLLTCAGLWWFSQSSDGQNGQFHELANGNDTTEMIESINKTANPQAIHLSDGSVVTLRKGSSLHYSTPFTGANRIVHLSGEAFFEIKKDPTRPFLVYANGVVTKVLGTSFNITAYPNDKNVVVEVKTGKVSVFSQKSPEANDKIHNQELNGVVATPNQKIIFNIETVHIEKKLIEAPAIVLPKSEQDAINFNFEDMPASDVFEVLKKAYEIDIIYDAAVLKSCPVTAPLTTQPLFEKLKIICEAIEAQYEVLDGRIVIQGHGCKN
jgi:transmembrane sensor